MSAVTISRKFQIVIPNEIREAFGLKPGQKVRMIAYDGRIEIVPVRPIGDLRGFAKGLDTTVEREPDPEL